MKQLSKIVLIVLILNVVGAIGYAGYSGMFAGDRLKAAFGALRGFGPSAAAASQPAELMAEATEAAGSQPAEEVGADVLRAELSQREADVRHQWEMIRAAQLQLLRDREQYEQEKKDAAAMVARREKPDGGEGYARELEYLSSIKAKSAKDFLRMKKDADVVEILVALEPRVGRKIIDACKSQEDRLWMGRILEQLRQRNHDQAEVLASGAQ